MAYSSTNPPYVLASAPGNARKSWGYNSTEGTTDVAVAGYFSDGWDRGMRVGDIVMHVSTGHVAIGPVSVATATGVTVVVSSH